MTREIGRMPSAGEIAAIEREARRMRGEVIRAGAVRLARAIGRLFRRTDSAAGPTTVRPTTARA